MGGPIPAEPTPQEATTTCLHLNLTASGDTELVVIPHVNMRWHPGSVLVLGPPEAGSALHFFFPLLSNIPTEKLKGDFAQWGLWDSGLNCPTMCMTVL